MNKLDGWKDKFIDENNDLVVILASNGDDLTAYRSMLSKLDEHKLSLKEYFEESEKELKERFGDDKRIPGWAGEKDEIIFAWKGTSIDFPTASELFPYLKDKSFWIEESWKTYNGEEYQKIFKKLKGSI